MSTIPFDRACFVVMPFGRKRIGPERPRWAFWRRDAICDFDWVYTHLFEPAIRAVQLPEGEALVPVRTDQEFVSGHIATEMFQNLEYSRLTLADITGLNFNVGLELGHRYRARASGTVLFRLIDAAIPFDLSHTRVFSYEIDPEDRLRASHDLITSVLQESLEQNRLDSPIQVALRIQQGRPDALEDLLRNAETAIRAQDVGKAIHCLRRAVEIDRGNPILQVRIGVLLKEQGRWTDALDHFDKAIALSPTYAEAYREKGIAEGKLYGKGDPPRNATGEESLRRALEYDPDDYDALASLGGVLKRQGRFDDAALMYHRASEASFGNPYPLLNQIVLNARAINDVSLDAATTVQLERVAQTLEAQVENRPPYNIPWSHFDLALARYFLGDHDRMHDAVEAGLRHCFAAWQPRTFLNTLELLHVASAEDQFLVGVMERLRGTISLLPGDQ